MLITLEMGTLNAISIIFIHHLHAKNSVIHYWLPNLISKMPRIYCRRNEMYTENISAHFMWLHVLDLLWSEKCVCLRDKVVVGCVCLMLLLCQSHEPVCNRNYIELSNSFPYSLNILCRSHRRRRRRRRCYLLPSKWNIGCTMRASESKCQLHNAVNGWFVECVKCGMSSKTHTHSHYVQDERIWTKKFYTIGQSQAKQSRAENGTG